MTTVNRLYRAVFTPNLPPRVERLARIYREAPQYKQRLWVALFLMSVVSVALVSALYLNLTASAAIAGRQIQYLEMEIEAQQRVNADMQVKLAELLSVEMMQRRAYTLGFRPVDREALEYMVVPGYAGTQRLQLASVSASAPDRYIPPEFNQTLLDWLDAQLRSVASSN